MAVKIVPAHFRVRCPRCKLEIEYDAEDVRVSKDGDAYVSCPHCACMIDHDPNHEIHVPEPEKEEPETQGPVDPANPYATW